MNWNKPSNPLKNIEEMAEKARNIKVEPSKAYSLTELHLMFEEYRKKIFLDTDIGKSASGRITPLPHKTYMVSTPKYSDNELLNLIYNQQ